MQRNKRRIKRKKILSSFIVLALMLSVFFLFPNINCGVDKKNEILINNPSIAVFPFENLSNDTAQQYFSDGIAEGFINSLAHVNGLIVCARSSSFQFRGKNVDLKEAGKQLGVHTILKGSVQREGDRVRISTQLINADDAFIFWSENYDENINDIYSLQDNIADIIAKKLKVGHQKLAKKKMPNKEAYDLYLKGRSFWNRRTPPNLNKAIEFFQQAISFDSSYAAAYSGIADCYTALGYGSFRAPKEAFPKALEAATKAIKLDSTLAEPHASLGYYRFYYDWDWAAAEEEFRIAIALNPNYEFGYDWYGYFLTAMERYDEARTIFKKAKELDPLSVLFSTDMGFSLYYSGNYDQAIKELQATLRMNPSGFPFAHLWLGRAYQEKKMYDNAIEEYRIVKRAIVDWPVAIAAIGNVYGLNGEKAEAKKILDTLSLLSTHTFVTSYGVALVYAGLGETEQSFLWLNKAFDERSNWLVWLKTDPRWALVQSDKRFTALVHKVGLPE